MSAPENSVATDPTHYSRMREWASRFLESTATELNRRLPWLRPDHLSYFGTLLTIGGGILASRSGEKEAESEQHVSILAFTLLLVGQAMDGIDGTYARFLHNKGYHIDFKHGGKVDVFNDRLQEGGLAVVRAYEANQRGDNWGRRAALFNAATFTLSSVARAYAESKGVCVSEDGKRWIHFWGTRPGRVILQTIATYIPEYGNVNVQAILDTIMGASNLLNAYDRFMTAGLVKASLPQNKIEEAKDRLEMLTKIGIVAATIAASLDGYFEWVAHGTSQTE